MVAEELLLVKADLRKVRRHDFYTRKLLQTFRMLDSLINLRRRAMVQRHIRDWIRVQICSILQQKPNVMPMTS